MFLDWKNQHCENDYTTQSNLQIQCNPYQTTTGIFHRASTHSLKTKTWDDLSFFTLPHLPQPMEHCLLILLVFAFISLGCYNKVPYARW